MYVIWQRLPRVLMCGYRDTQEEAEEFVKQLTAKNTSAIFDIRCVDKPEGEYK